MRYSSLRPRRRRHGTAAVELVLVSPVLITLALGAVDFGRFAYNYIAVTNAARAGASYGAMNSCLPTYFTTWQTNIQTAVTNEMSQQTGFVSKNLTVSSSSTIEGTGLRRVTVTASYPFTTVVNWPKIPSSTTLVATVVMRSVR
jgi:Flp pilus assembly protein TadG